MAVGTDRQAAWAFSPQARQALRWGGALLVVGMLGAACFEIIRPFLTAMAWAGLLAFLSWPAFEWTKGKLPRRWGEDTRGAWAAGLFTGVAFLALAVPLWWVASSSISAFSWGVERLEGVREQGLPAMAAAMKNHPVFAPVAERAGRWLASASADTEALTRWGLAAGKAGAEWLVKRGLGLGAALFEMAFALVFLFAFYVRGPVLAAAAGRALEGVLGPIQGRLRARTEATLRTVVRGAIGTALLQALAAGAGYAWLKVPGAGWLTLASFVLALLPMGPVLVWGPVAVWFFLTGEVRSGVWMVVWGAGVVGSLDNVARPFLTAGGAGEGWASLRRGMRRHVARRGTREGAWAVATAVAVAAGGGLPWWPGLAAAALGLLPRVRLAGTMAFVFGLAWAAATGRYEGALWMAVFAAVWLPLELAGRRWIRRAEAAEKSRGKKKGKRGNSTGRAVADSLPAKGAEPANEGKVSVMLMLTGLTGGTMAFGFIGLFLGPVLLALGVDVVAALAEESGVGSQESGVRSEESGGGGSAVAASRPEKEVRR